MTMCCGLSPIVASFAGSAIRTVMMAGRSKVRTRNDRVRTRCRYSRLMMSHVLRIGLAHRFDKDFFQGRFHDFELAQLCARRSGTQQFLRVAARGEPYFDIISVIV